MSNKFKLFDVRWVSHTAGPSPVSNSYGPNCRTELFFMGCERARQGNPCPDCFNPDLWEDVPGARELDPEEAIKNIENHAPQRYVTIVGGEPLDQIEGLALLCEQLHKRNFHTIVFTHYLIEEVKKMPYSTLLLNNCDVLVDGPYIASERIYDESWQDGFKDAVGSGNQIIWDLNEGVGLAARDLLGLYLGKDNVLKYITKETVDWRLI